MPKLRASLSILLSGSLLAVLAAGRGEAQVVKATPGVLAGLEIHSERLVPSQPMALLADHVSAVAAPVEDGWAAFRLGQSVSWQATVDQRSGLVAFAEGGNLAWIPGRGNSLSLSDLAPVLKPGAKKVDLVALEAIARGFLPKVAGMLGVDPKTLVLNLGRSGQPASHLWFVDFDVVLGGIGGMPVEGARVLFRVNSGNLIQFGSENLPAPGASTSTVPPTRLTRDAALAVVSQYLGGFSSGDSFADGGSLHLLPANVASTRSAEGFDFGAGRGLVKVWQFLFHRDGVLGTWRARVDATTGEILEFADVNEYSQATGGIYQNSPTTGPEIVRPMPYADVPPFGFASSAGVFSGLGATSTLNGQYVRINDSCGAISQAADGSGNIAFGTSAGTDCTTPGHGGAGNTHASREQFYQVNRIKEVGRGWLPGNVWLGQQLSVNVNLSLTCNAYWNGSTLNFFKSGGGCNNTGEIAGVSLHEYGHGLDQNDGTGTAPEGGTGESYADITATIALHSSCVGPGFLSGNCAGYGDACTACTGVRDIDFAKHASNTPATVGNFTQVRCGGGSGPCGREVHCESYVPSEAVWDFANRDLPGPGTGPAWTILDRLWYLSRNTATSSFTCHTGTTFTADGCAAGNWWKVMRAVDDDDGNLANGTPHGGALFAAFNRHGIACTTDPGASTTFSGCTPPAVPSLTVTGGDNSAALAWTSSGAVYDVFRNETGCNAGFTKIASGTASTSLTDTAVADGFTYYYQVTALPSGNEACASAPSACIAVTPAPVVTSTNAASYGTVALAPESIVAAFGSALATTTATAPSGTLPTTLGGTTVSVQDSAGTTRSAGLFFVSPGQVNYQMPTGTANGTATVTVTNGSGVVSTGHPQIASVAPGMFTADSSGSGVAAANILRVKADGTQTYEAVAQFNSGTGHWDAIPISFGASTDTLYLILYGTGIRFRSALSAVSVQVGSTSPALLYAGAQGSFVGEDQVNAGPLSRSLVGAGQVNVVLTADGHTANTVTLTFQ